MAECQPLGALPSGRGTPLLRARSVCIKRGTIHNTSDHCKSYFPGEGAFSRALMNCASPNAYCFIKSGTQLLKGATFRHVPRN